MKAATIHRLAYLCILIPFICACEGEPEAPPKVVKPNYITVVVTPSGVCMGQDSHGQNEPVPNLVVKVEMVKAGGETVSFEATTSESGRFSGQAATFELYREQPITCSGWVIGGHENLPYVFTRQKLTLTWAEVSAVKDFGETYTWAPHLIIFGTS